MLGPLLNGVACLSVAAEAQREGLSLRAGTDLGLGWAPAATGAYLPPHRHTPAFLRMQDCLSANTVAWGTIS